MPVETAVENGPRPDLYQPVEGHKFPLGTKEYLENTPGFHPDKQMPPPRTLWERYREVFSFINDDSEKPTLGEHRIKKNRTLWQALTAPLFPLKPETYVDAYRRPNPCPEEYWWNPWRWPNTRQVNPKIPPPVDGKYNDYYHYLAYRLWLRRERDVYVATCHLVKQMLDRCIAKEGTINGIKNCRHLWHKFFAMTRQEEFNQALLYMAITGNCIIRETPYPENFLEEKRKIYDDWLARTRMKKPGDVF